MESWNLRDRHMGETLRELVAFLDRLHFDETRAVEPLERAAYWTTREVAETFPSRL